MIAVGDAGAPTNAGLPAISWAYLVSEQFVDAGLGSCALVDALDDHRAGERRAPALAGQRSRDDDGVFGHASVMNLTGRAVDDPGRSAQEHAHRQHRSPLDDNPFGNLR